MASDPVLDVAVIGAGIAGINMGYFLTTKTPPGTTYAIFESRATLGGTWDLFRYPGIRSDSDIFTFGYSWNPWKKERTLATGDEILAYLHESACMHGIDKKIRYRHRVLAADWSSARKVWALKMEVTDPETMETATTKTVLAKFLVLGTGYYNYDQPFPVEIPGLLENFQGQIVYPQFWPRDLDYAGKEMVIVGSGATAVTLLPAVADKVGHVTMVQRSPTYIVPIKLVSPLTRLIRSLFPLGVASMLNRLWLIVTTYMFFYYSVVRPERARQILRRQTSKALPRGVEFSPTFEPRYNPWQQRLCVSPDGDFFAALDKRDKRGNPKAEIVTDTIRHVDGDTVHLGSGRALRPDVIVAATGLKLRFAGGISLSVDGGDPIDPSSRHMWRGCMLSDVPNLVFVMGYLTASYTLATEVTGTTLLSVLRSMRERGAGVAVPRVSDPKDVEVGGEMPKFKFTSTYFRDAQAVFPKIGRRGPWAMRKNYFVDLWRAKHGDNETDLDMF